MSEQNGNLVKVNLLTALLISGAMTADAIPTSFTEDFSSATVNPNLIAPTEFVFGPNSSPAGVAQNPSGTRRYVTTTATDFNTVDFIFQITIHVSTPTATQTPFVGFGSGLEDPNFFFEPHTSAYLRQFPDDFESGQLRLTVSSGAQVPPNQPPESIISPTPGPGNGTHRAQIQKTGDLVTFSLDENYTGVFMPDYSTTLSMTSDLSFLDDSNSRLFFGVQSGATTFDDLSIAVVPESSNTAVLMACGILCCAGFRRLMKQSRLRHRA